MERALQIFIVKMENLLIFVLVHAKNQNPYMESYLLDGGCFLPNNVAENAIRPFAVGQKNKLFADIPKGASASAAIYSLVETAKAYVVYAYF